MKHYANGTATYDFQAVVESEDGDCSEAVVTALKAQQGRNGVKLRFMKAPTFNARPATHLDKMEHGELDAEAYDSGVVYALARLVEIFNQGALAADILAASGVDVRNAAEYDVAWLRLEDPALARGRE